MEEEGEETLARITGASWEYTCLIQCDQIGQILKVFGNRFYYKSSPII